MEPCFDCDRLIPYDPQVLPAARLCSQCHYVRRQQQQQEKRQRQQQQQQQYLQAQLHQQQQWHSHIGGPNQTQFQTQNVQESQYGNQHQNGYQYSLPSNPYQPLELNTQYSSDPMRAHPTPINDPWSGHHPRALNDFKQYAEVLDTPQRYCNSPAQGYPTNGAFTRNGNAGRAPPPTHEYINSLSEDEDDDDHFEDAQEELTPQPDHVDRSTDVLGQELDGDGDMTMDETPAGADQTTDCDDDDGGSDDADSEPDLFGQTFGGAHEQNHHSEDDGSEDEDTAEHLAGTSEKDSEGEDNDDEDQMDIPDSDTEESHPKLNQKPNDSAQAKKTNPSKPLPNTTTPSPPEPPSGPDLLEDRSPALRRLTKFHNKATQLIPRLPLAQHRYWIGVLNLDTNPRNFSSEKHFTWMKGNRLSTVSTIWHTFQTSTATDGFVLLLGDEKVEFTDRVEELDYYDDKRVIFRAVKEGTAEAKGRRVSEGAVPVEYKGMGEVIVIED